MKIAKEVTASPTIYHSGGYKVSVYPASAEGKHKENHVSVVVKTDNEAGNIAVSDGRVLNGNLSQSTINWCHETILSEENKKRVTEMLSTNDYYRLDRPDEVAAHNGGTKKNASAQTKGTAIDEAEKETAWENTFIRKIAFLDKYRYLVTFADGSVKTVDLEKEMRHVPSLFKPLIERPEMARDVFVEPMGTGIYWDDKMGFPCDLLYEIGRNVF